MILGSCERTKFLGVSLCSSNATRIHNHAPTKVPPVVLLSAVSFLPLLSASFPVLLLLPSFCLLWLPPGGPLLGWFGHQSSFPFSCSSFILIPVPTGNGCEHVCPRLSLKFLRFLFCRARKNLWGVLRQRRHSPLVVSTYLQARHGHRRVQLGCQHEHQFLTR